MALPDFQAFFLPTLESLSDGQTRTNAQIYDIVKDKLDLSADDLRDLVPSRTEPRWKNRVAWSLAHLRKAGLIERPSRGNYRITERGRETLDRNLERLSMNDLIVYPEYREYTQRSQTDTATPSTNEDSTKSDTESPEELIAKGFAELHEELAEELLEVVKNSNPDFFERLVVNLIVRMGYGGSIEDAGSVVGKSGDEGIDGVIKEDRLGLDTIYLQAKKWEATVGRPEIQQFQGALAGKRARKGIFITTSGFSKQAYDYVNQIDTKIVLIDGLSLAKYMIDFDLGVSTISKYEIKRMDSDYFEA